MPDSRGMAFDGLDSTAQRPRHGHAVHESITAIEGGRVVTPTGTIEGGTILIAGDRIDRVRPEAAPLADHTIDASDRVVIPGIVDTHGDDIEQQLEPRSGAEVDPATAVYATDRLNVSHGVTTKAHALAFESEESGQRPGVSAGDLIQTITQMDHLLGTNLVHARFEASSLDPTGLRNILDQDDVVMASLMHHVPGEGQYDSSHDMSKHLNQTEIDDGDLSAIRRDRSVSEDSWEDIASRLSRVCRDTGVPVATHDDSSVERVERAASCGIEICEFPLRLDAAICAHELGRSVVMGAPNLIRGESLFDNLSTETAIENGVVDVLCSDYHPPSLLQSIFVETGDPLHERVARVSERPARLMGLGERGRIAPGARADLVVVDPDPTPRPTQVLVGGDVVFQQDV